MDELNNILELVKNYIDKKEKTWTPGKDWVQYAGPYFTSEEYTSSIKSLLNGWLVLGQDAIAFETKFPKHLGKEYGSKYDDSSFDEILRLRYDKSLPTIVTTNVALIKQISNGPRGSRLASLHCPRGALFVAPHSPIAIKLAFPPAAAVFTVTVCSSVKRAR